MIPETPRARGELFVVGGDHASFAGRDDLVAVEGEGGDVSQTSGRLAMIPGAMRLRGVLDDDEAAPPGDGSRFVHRDRTAVGVHGDERVRGPIVASTCVRSRFQVTGSASTSTGVAPVYATAFAVAIIVNVGRITSSPFSRPRAASARWSAVVPLEQATPKRQPTALEKASSKRSTNGPRDEIQLERMHSVK